MKIILEEYIVLKEQLLLNEMLIQKNIKLCSKWREDIYERGVNK